MGEAKRRAAARAADPIIYHHTSTLRTNLIWMAGSVLVEGQGRTPLHPVLGEVQSDPRYRRAMSDFPAVAWFTTDINVPQCLIQHSIFLKDPKTGNVVEKWLNKDEAAAISLERVALGFRIADIKATPWPSYPGYDTPEGAVLNDTARDVGDDPNKWYVTEHSVDLDHMTEVWLPKKRYDLKLIQSDKYLGEVRKLIAMCKSRSDAYVPPSWLTEKEARQLAQALNVPVAERE